MDHRALLANLSREQRSALLEQADAPGFVRLASQWGAMALLVAWIVCEGWAWPVAMLPLGILLVFQFTLLHEVSHLTAFRTRWMNEALARLCGVLLILPPRWFRYFHFAHHRYTQDPERDPELASPKPATLPAYIWHISGLPIWRSQLSTLLRNAAGQGREAFVPDSKRAIVQRESLAMLLFYSALLGVSIALGSALLLWIWGLPLLLGQPFLRLYLLAEHGRCPLVANMLENSRTTFTNRLVRWLAWNMPYHAEHHSFPAVPFFRLPALHRLTKPHLMTTERGYHRFHAHYLAWLKRGR